MSDLVKRLRADTRSAVSVSLPEEAADEIERLQARQDEAAKAWTKLTDSQEQEIEQLQCLLQRALACNMDNGLREEIRLALKYPA